VRVLDIHVRSTVVHTRYDEQVIVPNSTLVQSNVKNFTLHDTNYRVSTEVGVSYASDMERVATVLEGVGRERSWRVADKDPVVLLTKFGDSAVVFELSVWCNDPWRSRRAQSDLNMAIWPLLLLTASSSRFLNSMCTLTSLKPCWRRGWHERARLVRHRRRACDFRFFT
jgi:small-conductance mechanosensitive channel